MKLSDLFVDYCSTKDGLRIVTIPNTDIYYAIRNDGGIASRDAVYRLKKSQVDDLVSGKLSSKKIYEDYNRWHHLDSLNQGMPDYLVTRLAAKAGFDEEKI